MAKERQTERRRLEDEQKRNARKEVFSWVRMFATVIVVVFDTFYHYQCKGSIRIYGEYDHDT